VERSKVLKAKYKKIPINFGGEQIPVLINVVSTLLKIRHLWRLKTVPFQHRCLIYKDRFPDSLGSTSCWRLRKASDFLTWDPLAVGGRRWRRSTLLWWWSSKNT